MKRHLDPEGPRAMLARVELGQTYALARTIGPRLRAGDPVRAESFDPERGILVRRPHAGWSAFVSPADLAHDVPRGGLLSVDPGAS